MRRDPSVRLSRPVGGAAIFLACVCPLGLQETGSPREVRTVHVPERPGAEDGAESIQVSLQCPNSIRDQAAPSTCLQASSVPTPGLLFPGPHLGGVNNVQSGTNSFVGGGRQNEASGSHAMIGGGRLNDASGYAAVGGGLSNYAGSFSAVGGGNDNTAGFNATIGGGLGCTASGTWSTIGGGYFNTANGYWSTVGGGYRNHANYRATVGGGQYNFATGTHSAIGGGAFNIASGIGASVAGGSGNTASASDSAIPGGFNNTAAGTYSFAAGRRAKANHQGSFVWGDSQNVDKPSSAIDQFNVYAEGGVRMFAAGIASPSLVVDAAGSVGIGTSAPAFLLEVNGSAGKPGGGDWSVSSDERLKKDVRDLEDALATLLALRGVSFEFKDPQAIGELPGPRIGFIAQEVEQVLPDWVDEGADGYKRLTVRGFEALAVEALREVVRDARAKDERIAELEERLRRLEAAIPPGIPATDRPAPAEAR